MCSQITTDKIIKCNDKGSPYSMFFNNPNQTKCIKHRVDGCLITTGIRCDYLLIDSKNIEHFVELKGNDIIHGCDQLEETIIKLSKDKKKPKCCFIVSSGVPKVNTTIQKKKLLFKTKYNSSLTIKNKYCEHHL